MSRLNFLTLVSLGAAAIAATASPVLAEVSFKSKKLSVIVASRPGDGTDVMMRVLGRMFEKYLPGKPQMIYRNMPAGAGVRAINYFVEKVKPNGLTWLGASGSSLRPEHLKKKSVRYDPRNLRMIGGLPAPSAMLVIRKDSIGRLTDKSKRPLIMGEVRGDRATNHMAVFGPEYLGWNIRWVVGYSGSGAMTLSYEQGETQAYVNYNNYVLAPMRASKDNIFIAQTGSWKGGKFVKRPDYADVPLFSDMVKSKIKDGLAREAFDAWESTVQAGKWYALPPKTPDNIFKVYTAAYDKAMKDPEYKKEANKLWTPNFLTSNAAETQQLAAKMMTVSDAALAYTETLKRKVGIPPAIPGLTRLRTKLTAVKGGEVKFKRRKKTIKSKIDAKTRITIGGKKAMASDLKTGMKCEVLYPKKGSAAALYC